MGINPLLPARRRPLFDLIAPASATAGTLAVPLGGGGGADGWRALVRRYVNDSEAMGHDVKDTPQAEQLVKGGHYESCLATLAEARASGEVDLLALTSGRWTMTTASPPAL